MHACLPALSGLTNVTVVWSRAEDGGRRSDLREVGASHCGPFCIEDVSACTYLLVSRPALYMTVDVVLQLSCSAATYGEQQQLLRL